MKFQEEINKISNEFHSKFDTVFDDIELNEKTCNVSEMNKKYSVIVKNRQAQLNNSKNNKTNSLQNSLNNSIPQQNKPNASISVNQPIHQQNNETKIDENSLVNSIEEIQPKQHQITTKTINVRVTCSKGTMKIITFQFDGDNQTTMGQLIAHIKWMLQQKNIENVNGILKDGRMKEMNYKMNQTLLALNLNRYSLNYILPK